jgi:hypothetical protein
VPVRCPCLTTPLLLCVVQAQRCLLPVRLPAPLRSLPVERSALAVIQGVPVVRALSSVAMAARRCA